jgi:hypothetical protein
VSCLHPLAEDQMGKFSLMIISFRVFLGGENKVEELWRVRSLTRVTPLSHATDTHGQEEIEIVF